MHIKKFYKFSVVTWDSRNMLYPKLTWKNVKDENEIISSFSRFELNKSISKIEGFGVKYDQDSDIREFPDVTTDFSVIRASYFYVSQKVKDIFDRFSLCDHIFIPITIDDENVREQYYLFQYLPKTYDLCIDYEKSIFTEWESGGVFVGDKDYILQSAEGYNELWEEFRRQETKYWPGPKKLIFNKVFDNVGFANLLNLSTIVSQELKEVLEVNNVTGIEIKEIPHVEFWVEE